MFVHNIQFVNNNYVFQTVCIWCFPSALVLFWSFIIYITSRTVAKCDRELVPWIHREFRDKNSLSWLLQCCTLHIAAQSNEVNIIITSAITTFLQNELISRHSSPMTVNIALDINAGQLCQFRTNVVAAVKIHYSTVLFKNTIWSVTQAATVVLTGYRRLNVIGIGNKAWVVTTDHC